MAGFSGREMCLSQSQPLDHINTFDLVGEREKLWAGVDWETGKGRDGNRGRPSCAWGDECAVPT